MNTENESIGIIEHEVAILVRRAISANTVMNKKMKGLDRSAYLILRQLEEHGSAGVKALANEFHLDISTVSRQVGALETNGLAERLPDPKDGRGSLFIITEAGLHKLYEVRHARIDRFRELLKDWTEEECEKFGELLTRLNRTFTD